MISRFSQMLTQVSRSQKRSVLIGYDIGAMLLALWASLSARLGQPYWPDSAAIVIAAVLSFGAGIAGLYYLDVYRIVLRFFDLRTVGRIFFAAAIAAVAWVLIVYLVRPVILSEGVLIAVPRSM